MNGKFLLIVFCMVISLNTMGQSRKSSASSGRHPVKASVPIASDSLPGQDTSKGKIEEITADEVDNFCDVLMQLIKDASGNFERIKGKSIETVSNNTRYTSMGGVPGTITSCLIHSPSQWQYEGILYQGNSKDDMQTVFDKYKKSLDNCLPAKGYTMTMNKKSTSKQDSYPEYSYSKADDGSSSSTSKNGKHNSPRTALDVDYTAGANIYVLTLNVWSN